MESTQPRSEAQSPQGEPEALDATSLRELRAEVETETRAPKTVEELMTSVITDWTCVSAGISSPLSENSIEHLRHQLDVKGAPDMEGVEDSATLSGEASDYSDEEEERPDSNALAASLFPPSKRRRMQHVREVLDFIGGSHNSSNLSNNNTWQSRNTQLLPTGQLLQALNAGQPSGSGVHPGQAAQSSDLSLPQLPSARPALIPRILSAFQTNRPPLQTQHGRRAGGQDGDEEQSTWYSRLLPSNLRSRISAANAPAILPLSKKIHEPSVIFLSQLFPCSFGRSKRRQLMKIFKSEAQYVPRCITEAPGSPTMVFHGSLEDGLRPSRQRDLRSQLSRIYYASQFPRLVTRPFLQWPASKIPTEIFESISVHLSRDDVKAMRLTCKEFEEKLSHFFNSVVVPFSPELYSLGGGKEKLQHAPSSRRDRAVYRSDLRMFRERGWTIRQFAIAFEFDENLLSTPLSDIAQPQWTYSETFYGTLKWPAVPSARYDRMRELENTAEQTQDMKAAFAMLTSLHELGLCLDNGFGWLNGPDQSDRAVKTYVPLSIFRPRFSLGPGSSRTAPGSVFSKPKRNIPTDEMFRQYARVLSCAQDCTQHHLDLLVEYMVSTPIGKLSEMDPLEVNKHVGLFFKSQGFNGGRCFWMTVDDFTIQRQGKGKAKVTSLPKSSNKASPLSHAALKRYTQKLAATLASGAKSGKPRDGASMRRIWRGSLPRLTRFDDIDLSDSDEDMQNYRLSRLRNCRLKPARLTNLQLRLLKENEWAQLAFLNTFALSVIDNPTAMHNVRFLRIAKLPGSQVQLLDRRDFWAGLPNVEHLTLMVAPDWREVPSLPTFPSDPHDEKAVRPSLASERLGRFLARQMENNHTVTSLRVGFVGGGEHATGMYARNKHVPPAPFLPSNGNFADVLVLPYVEKLTLVNCWMSATALQRLAMEMGHRSLHTLRLESFSLVAFNGLSTSMDRTEWLHTQRRPTMSVFSTPSVPSWAAGYRYTKFLVPVLNETVVRDFAIALGTPLATHVTRAVSPRDCLQAPPMPGTWAAVLQTLFPCELVERESVEAELATVDTVEPALPRLELESCGYVKLQHQRLVPEFDTVQSPPQINSPLSDRRMHLATYMLQTHDVFLGSIVPHCIASEETTLTFVYDLTVGWPDDNERRNHNLEDGQNEGGRGRYSGTVETRGTPLAHSP